MLGMQTYDFLSRRGLGLQLPCLNSVEKPFNLSWQVGLWIMAMVESAGPSYEFVGDSNF